MNYDELLGKAFEKIQKKTTSDRFRVPEIISELQGNKTMIKNFSEVASSIRRDPNHLAKYFFNELAAPGVLQGDALILQTKISRDSLKRKFDEYMKEYVYCKVCGEPDTKISKEDRLTFIVCEACGAKKPAR